MPVLIPTTLTEALDALASDPSATLLAGGTDLMVEINGGHRRPESVIALNRLAELRTWTYDAVTSTLRIGAGVTYAELEDEHFRRWVPALSEAARTVGSPQIRHAATIGGNLGTCSPAGDGLPVISALDGVVHLASIDGIRQLSFGEFMLGPKRTALRPGELIEAITVPVFAAWQGYAKVGVRNAMVISNAGACLAVDDHGGVRLALGSVGPTIIRCAAAESFANTAVDHARHAVSDDAATEFGRLAASESAPIDDHRSTAAYRRHAIAVLARRLLRRAFPDEA